MLQKILLAKFLLLFSTVCVGQVNGIRLSVRSYLDYSQNTLIINDTIALIPSTSGNGSRFYDFSLVYYSQIGKLNFYIGAGLSKGSNQLKQESQTGLNYKRVDKSERIEKGFHIKLGTSTWANIISPKVFFALNSGLYFGLNYEEKTDFADEIFDGNTYLEGRQVIIKYNDDITFGLNAELSLYYKIFNKLFIGLNHNSLFYVNFENGVTKLNAHQYGLNRSILTSINQKQEVKLTNYSKSHLFSVSILKEF